MKKVTSTDALTLKHFFGVSASFRTQYLLSWLSGVSAVGATIVVPYLIGKILGSLTNPNAEVNGYLYALAVTAVLTFIINRIAFNNHLGLQPRVMAYLQTEALDSLLKRGTSFHNNRVSGKLVSDATDYPASYLQLSGVFFSEIMPFALVVIIGITLVAIHSVFIGLILLLMTTLVLVSTVRFRRRMAPFRKERHAAGKELIGHLADTIVNNQTVKSFGNEDRELSKHRVLNEHVMALRTRDWMELAKDGSHRIFGLLVFQTIFIIAVVHQVRADPELLATGIFAFSYTVTLSNRLFQIGTMMRTVEESLLLAAPMTEMLQEKPEINDREGAQDIAVHKGEIHFREVTFYYNDNPKHEKVFASLNLLIRPGERVGLVGPSGGGKTTLTKLLLRFEDVQKGQILIDGQDIAGVTQTSLRRSVAYVPQEPLLFHRSIKENIAYARPEATEEEIKHAAQQAHAHDFIMKLPGTYDTIVGERGVKLSGGQRQRIAIARAILKNAPVLLLDEATSALDSESEIAIQKALWQLMQDRTTVVVAHRLSTIQRLDRIIVLDDGKIVEEGSHKELLKREDLYARLWNHQSGGFIEE